MQQTSPLYQALLQDPATRKEIRVTIDGQNYGESSIVSLSTSANLFPEDTMSVGGAIAKEIDLVLYRPGTISRMARIAPAYRLVKGTQASEWIPKGVFYVDTRSYDAMSGTLAIHGYDDMLKAEQEWVPDQSLAFPMPMEAAFAEIARLMGLTVDPRTRFNSGYLVDYPANGYTLRDVLRFIAAAHGANCIVTDAGQLRMVGFAEIPPETNYLVTHYGAAITFGGVRILV